jgi:hypothetical protein
MDSDGQTWFTVGAYFKMYIPYYNSLGDLHFALILLLFPSLFSVISVIVLISYHMQIYPAV